MMNMTTDQARLALSIRQPWVELILLGRKTIEVRSWTTRHRGPLWLHAGMARDIQAKSNYSAHSVCGRSVVLDSCFRRNDESKQVISTLVIPIPAKAGIHIFPLTSLSSYAKTSQERT